MKKKKQIDGLEKRVSACWHRFKTVAISPVLTTALTIGEGVAAHNHAGQAVPTSATWRESSSEFPRASLQNKQLSSRAFSLGMSSGGVIRVGDSASRSWSPCGYRELVRPVHSVPQCAGS